MILINAWRSRRGICIRAALLAFGIPLLGSGQRPLDSSVAQPPVRIPSQVVWTEQTIEAATSGNAVRGLVLAHRCVTCHGQEGFSSNSLLPNLAGMDKLAMWKELIDFRDGKRTSPIMNAIAAVFSNQDFADLAAYYAMLPTYPDPQDPRAFPQAPPAPGLGPVAVRLIVVGDGKRGIPPCQACHGPIGHKAAAPSLLNQNGPYIQEELENFSSRRRANDIDMPMRSIAGLLTEEERQALAAFYGAGFGDLRAGASRATK